jgi:hypothetical protein
VCQSFHKALLTPGFRCREWNAFLGEVAKVYFRIFIAKTGD